MIKIENLSKYYHTKNNVTCALKKINLEFKKGEFVAITGESGSGKSVLTKTFSGMLDSNGFISNGDIILSDDETIFNLSWDKQKEIIKENFYRIFPYKKERKTK